LPQRAFNYVDDQGLARIEDYPYTDGASGETTTDCSLKGKNVAVETGKEYLVNWYGEVGDDTYTTRAERMKYALAEGPVAIAMKSSCKKIMTYRKGVITDDFDCKCSPEDDPCHDHAVLMVGYNDLGNPPYWMIKNSWGRRWGETTFF